MSEWQFGNQEDLDVLLFQIPSYGFKRGNL